jgi:4-diphosphocytidyl-2-C-methyl-D-erythritol kinase
VTDRVVEVSAPGKVNLILRVLDRRPDAYHNLWSVMQTVELADTVTVEDSGGADGIHVSCEGADLPTDSTNLAYQAAERVLARLRRRPRLRVHIRKRLPVAGGVGGGSSDAAAVIDALAKLFDTGWSREEKAALGLEIGSDVPFFFYGPTAVVEGRGERVSPLRVDGGGWLVLVNPGIAISTGWAYAKLAAARAERTVLQAPVLALAGLTWADVLAAAQNDFGPVMEQEYPALAELRQLLLERGAQIALLSGSGSTVFGLFSTESAARFAAEGLGRRPEWRVWVTRTQTPADPGQVSRAGSLN